MTKYTDKGALLSQCGRYRYKLWREWRASLEIPCHSSDNWRWAKVGKMSHGEPKSLVFVMLNPSTADASFDDPTIRRCVSFAQRLKFERLEVVNLFALRTPHPNLMRTALIDPVGPDNIDHVKEAAWTAGQIICAWGTHGTYMGQDQTVLGWIHSTGARTYCLGKSKEGHPRHPLYLSGDSPLIELP